MFFFFSSRRRHTRLQGDWSSDVCSSDLFPLARLEAAVDQDRATLVEVLAAGLRLLAPDDDRDERGLLALLAPLRRVVAVDRKPQVGHGGAARRVAQLWGAGPVTGQENPA